MLNIDEIRDHAKNARGACKVLSVQTISGAAYRTLKWSLDDVPALCNEVEALQQENASIKEKASQTVDEYLAKEQEVLALKAERDEEVSRRYQAECNYDHAVKDRNALKRALENMAWDLQEQYGHSDAANSTAERYIQRAKEEMKK